jgi:hypothetical protein
LYLIGTCSTYLSTEALKAAVAEAKSGKDVVRYQQAVRALAEVSPNEPEAIEDTKWVDHMQRVVKSETDRLEHELRGYKNNLIKESIRVSGILLDSAAMLTLLVHRWATKISDYITIRSATWWPLPRPTPA